MSWNDFVACSLVSTTYNPSRSVLCIERGNLATFHSFDCVFVEHYRQVAPVGLPFLVILRPMGGGVIMAFYRFQVR